MSARLARTGLLSLAILAAATAGCHTPGPHVPQPGEATRRLARRTLQVIESEQVKPAKTSIEDLLALLDEAALAGDEGVPAVLATLDALVWRSTPGLSRVASLHALAFRSPGALAHLETQLGKLHARPQISPPAKLFVAEALLDLARFRGDDVAAEKWRRATGALREATVVGPLDWAAISTIQAALPFEKPGTPLQASYPGRGAFAKDVHPTLLPADDGRLDVTAVATQAGLYGAIFDVDVPRSMRLTVALRSSGGAVLVVGGKPVITRPYDLGPEEVMRLSSVEVDKGKIRIVVRLGQNDDGGRFGVNVLGEDGAPLPLSAPAVGSSAMGSAGAVGTSPLERAQTDAPPLATAALLALGEVRTARRLLDDLGTKEGATPAAALLYARAALRSDDAPEIRRVERARQAYARVTEAWPTSWEAAIGGALMAAARKGANEGRVESLRELAKLREKGGFDPMLQAFEGATAAEVRLRDVAETSLAALKEPLAGTSVWVEMDDALHPRSGQEGEDRYCLGQDRDRQTLRCYTEKVIRGDGKGAMAEIERIRKLRGSPSSLALLELSRRLADGDRAGALALYDRLLPGQRTMSVLGAYAATDPDGTRKRIARDRLTARDAPGALAPLARLLGDDPAPGLEKIGRAAVLADRAGSAGSAATLVLLHTESYDLDASGLLRFVLHDVRRVSGTADVERVDAGTIVLLNARDVRRTLRRTIHKKDGRILEPDRAPTASQANADLSQLEPGDYLEHVVEGVALPTRVGHLVVNTPDLLPDRTGVKEARITLRYPKSLALARWGHGLLGKPVESEVEGSHQVVYTMQNAPPRRLEEGVPRMNRDVTLSFGTYSWSDLARQLGEHLTSLEDHDPYVTRWAKGIAPEAKDQRAQVEKILAVVGKTIRVPSGALLSDSGASLSSGAQATTTRAMIELGAGSRTWLLHRALAELGIKHEIVVAETDVFASEEAFPAQPGRFDHPLLKVSLPADQGGDQYIDADVDGPPLPLGQITPDLRGRKALSVTSGIEEIKTQSDAASITDNVKVVLTLDEKGDATGTFEATIRGRPAQSLADALERVVGTDRREMLRGVVLGWLPWANVNEVSLSSAEGSWAVTVHAEVVLPAYAQRDGKGLSLPGLEPLHQVVPRPAAATLGATYTTRLGRDSALAVDTAFQYVFEREVKLPGTRKAKGKLPASTVEDPRLKASRETTLTGGSLREVFRLSLTPGTVATSRYDEFARAVKTTDDGFLATVRLDP